MNSQPFVSPAIAARVAFAAAAMVALLGVALPAHAQSVASGVCSLLVKLMPEVRSFKPEGARAQLVMAVAEKFEYDAAALRRVKAEVDAATTASCPKEREAMLGILKMKSLAEALS